jgi:hypothetical protein
MFKRALTPSATSVKLGGAAGEKFTQDQMGCNVQNGKKLPAAQMQLACASLGVPYTSPFARRLGINNDAIGLPSSAGVPAGI